MGFPFIFTGHHNIKPVIQNIVQINVCQDWTCTISLRGSPFPIKVFAVFHNACFQKSLYNRNKLPVSYVVLQHFNQPIVVYRIKEGTYVSLHYIARFMALDIFYRSLNRHMTISSRAKAIAYIIEFPVVHMYKYFCYRILYNLVFITGNT